MSKAERDEKLPQTSFAELKIGDSIFSSTLLSWRFVLSVPYDVAEEWVVHHFSESVISTSESAPPGGSIKRWEDGVGIVVAASTTLPGEERLCLLHKAGGDDFRIYLSKETRETPQESKD